MPWTYDNSLKTIIDRSFSQVAFDLWRHHSWSVTSRERDVLIVGRHIRRLFLYVQIGAQLIFTSE